VGRNPFVFGARRAPSVARDREEPVAPEPPSPPPVPFTPPAPQIKLSGIAASKEGDVTVLTAIITDNGALAFVKVGDKLPSGATVIKIEDTGVILMDPAGITQTIRLP
jgi:type II secretory pathway component PulC